MKRRIGLIFVAGTTTGAAVATTTLLDEHHLVLRKDMENELDSLSNNEFAPLAPTEQMKAHNRAALGLCSSPLTMWANRQVREMGYETYKSLYDSKVLQMPYIYKHYIDKNENEEYFANDVQTKELKRRHRDTIAFWTKADIDNSIMTDKVLLLSMHGSDLKDEDKLVPTIMRLFDFKSMSDILAFATKVQQLVENIPGGYDNPLLTMNAVSTRSLHNQGVYNGHDDPSRPVKDSIIIGDGVLDFLKQSGMGSNGPDFLHAHEFAHHLQFQMDMAVPPGATYVNDDRRKELMADAISGYFLAHDMGADMPSSDVSTLDQIAFATGDCRVAEDDHHGTPEQRSCASIWGASRAAADDVPLLDPEEFVSHFDDAYDGILKLDAEACTLVLEGTSSLDHDPEGAVQEEDGGNLPLSPHGPPEEGLWETQDGPEESSSGSTDKTDPSYQNFVDRGNPSDTKDSYKRGKVRNCEMPWVYCSAAQNLSFSRPLHVISAIAVSFIALFWS